MGVFKLLKRENRENMGRIIGLLHIFKMAIFWAQNLTKHEWKLKENKIGLYIMWHMCILTKNFPMEQSL